MKKLLSLLLAVIMAFSVVSFTVNAQETDTPSTGESETTPDVPAECAHEWNTRIIIDATCTEKGVKLNECKLCGKEEPAEYFGPYAHDYGETVTVKPTCSSKGYTGKVCSKCGDIDIESETPALEHTYGEWADKLAPTCTEKGSKERICTACNEIETEEIPALGHDYKATVIAPGYEAGGYTLHECKRCVHSYQDTPTDKLDGRVESLELGEKIVLNYEDTIKIDMSGLVVGGDVDYTVSYKVTHRLPEEKVIEVDEKEGTIKAVGMGNAKLTVTVTDEYNNVVEDTVDVQVNFSILDWFKLIGSILMAAIEIVLGGLDFSALGQLFK